MFMLVLVGAFGEPTGGEGVQDRQQENDRRRHIERLRGGTDPQGFHEPARNYRIVLQRSRKHRILRLPVPHLRIGRRMIAADRRLPGLRPATATLQPADGEIVSSGIASPDVRRAFCGMPPTAASAISPAHLVIQGLFQHQSLLSSISRGGAEVEGTCRNHSWMIRCEELPTTLQSPLGTTKFLRFQPLLFPASRISDCLLRCFPRQARHRNWTWNME